MGKIVIFLCLLFQSLFGQDAVALRCRDAGMFSIFMDVINVLEAYEAQMIRGVKVDFQTAGLYYDASVGDNWWNYYFEPIALGNLASPLKSTSGLNEYRIAYKDYCWDHHAVIQKYVHIKPHIQEKIDQFMEHEQFEDHFMIGVHYRGTDKRSEAGRVGYNTMMQMINQAVHRFGNKKNWKIFVATDEQKFLEHLKTIYPDRVCYIEAIRSEDAFHPVHLNSPTPYRVGEEALMDCLLLSKTKVIIRTVSNLSECAKYFNPKLKVILVNY